MSQYVNSVPAQQESFIAWIVGYRFFILDDYNLTIPIPYMYKSKFKFKFNFNSKFARLRFEGDNEESKT